MQILRNDVLIRPCQPKEKTQGGLFVPDSIKQRPNCGHIISVGPKSYLKPGQKLFHVEQSGEPIEANGELLYLIKEMDVLSYIEN